MSEATASGTVLGVVDTLAHRIDNEGPLPAKDAVRLVARMARAVERLHAGGRVHGKLGPHAVTIPGQDLADAWIASATACTPDPAYHSPERRSGGGPSTADDIYAMALTLFFALTGWKDEVLTGSTTRPPPLAVFDAGDDRLEAILDAALGDRSSRPKTLAKFRAALDQWLERDGAPSTEPLDVGPRKQATPPPQKASLDLAALPPPPPPSAPAATAKPVTSAPLFEVQDEDSTWRQPEVRETSRVARAPKLVPPKLASKMPPRLPAPADPSGDEDEARPTLPFDGDVRRLPALAEDGASADAATEEGKPAARGGRKPSVVLVVAGTAVVVAGGWLLLRGSSTGTSTSTSTTTPTASMTTTASTTPTASPKTTASTAPTATTTPTATSSVAAAPTSSADAASSAEELPPAPASTAGKKRKHTAPGACLETLFAEDSFDEEGVEGALDFVCEDANPIHGAPRVREVLVKEGRGKVTGGMKEWALLGFYELAAYAVLRDRCCSSKAPPLELPVSPGKCPPLADSLGEVARASRPGTDAKETSFAIDRFDEAVRCITRSKQTKLFGGYPRPSGGEGTALKKTMARARGEAK